MEFAKGMYDLKGKTIKDMRMSPHNADAIFITTDNMVMIVEYGVNEDDDYSSDEIGCTLLTPRRCQNFLKNNRWAREWFYELGVLTKEELYHYEELLREDARKALEETKQKEVENEKRTLKRLMGLYPELVAKELGESKNQ